MTEHVEKTEDAGNSLGSHRRHSHARGSHMEDDDKEKVQNDIQDGRKNQGKSGVRLSPIALKIAEAAL